MRDNYDNDKLVGGQQHITSSDVSKKNKPSSFKSKIIGNKNMLDAVLSFLKPEKRTRLFFVNKHVRQKLFEVECIRRDKLYADYLYCLNYDHETLKRIINNIFESDVKQLNKKLEEADEKTQNIFHFDKEKREIMACMRSYLKIYMYQMILAEIFSLIRGYFDADCINSYSEISECIENIIKNEENQQKRIDKILALEKMEQITKAKTFWDEIQEIRSDETCRKIKENNKDELRDVMYRSLWFDLLTKEILPEINQRCDAKDKTIAEIQTDLATNQSKVEQYQRELEDLQKKAKCWNILSASVNFNMPKKQKNVSENKKFESEQHQLPVEDLANQSILSLNNNNLKVSLDDLESSIKFCDENIKINKEAQEKVEEEINEGKENIAKFERQIAELPVHKEISNNIKNIKEPRKNKLDDVAFSFLLDNLNNIQMLESIVKAYYGEDCVYYDDEVDYISRFIIYSLDHCRHENFLLAIIESSKILHELLESNYSEEEEQRWRRSYYEYFTCDRKTRYCTDKIKAWGHKYGQQCKDAARRNLYVYGVDDDLCHFMNCFLLDDRYSDYNYSDNTYSTIYVFRSWDNSKYKRESYAALGQVFILFVCFAILSVIFLDLGGLCVPFFVGVALSCIPIVMMVELSIEIILKFKADDEKKENFSTEFIKSNMWYCLLPHGFMLAAISFAIAFSYSGAISLALYLTGAAFSGFLYSSLILAACSAVLFIIFGIRVRIKKKKYKDWTSKMDKFQEDRKNGNKLINRKRFYDKFLANNQALENQKQNLNIPTQSLYEPR